MARFDRRLSKYFETGKLVALQGPILGSFRISTFAIWRIYFKSGPVINHARIT